MPKRNKDAVALSRGQLSEGHRACRENSQRLIADARILIEAGRYRAGYMTVLLASEELGKAVVMRLGLMTERGGWKTWSECRKNYYDHPTKHAAAILYYAEAAGRADEVDVLRRLDEAGRRVATFRERIMYVDFDGSSFYSPPSESEMEGACRDELEFAEWLLRELSP